MLYSHGVLYIKVWRVSCGGSKRHDNSVCSSSLHWHLQTLFLLEIKIGNGVKGLRVLLKSRSGGLLFLCQMHRGIPWNRTLPDIYGVYIIVVCTWTILLWDCSSQFWKSPWTIEPRECTVHEQWFQGLSYNTSNTLNQRNWDNMILYLEKKCSAKMVL